MWTKLLALILSWLTLEQDDTLVDPRGHALLQPTLGYPRASRLMAPLSGL